MSEEKDDKWEMPKPVFRSSSGSLPKSFEDTISVAPNPLDEPDPDDDILGIMSELPTLEANVEASDEPAEKNVDSATGAAAVEAEHEAIIETGPKRAGFWSFAGIFLLIALLAAAIVAGLFYYFTVPPE